MRLAVAVGSRANWGSVRAVVERLRQEHDVTCVCYATALLSRYGAVVDEIENVAPVRRLYTHVEGENRETSGLSTALAQSAWSSYLAAHPLDGVYLVGDRYEVVPVAYAAHLAGVPVLHQMGGEISGTIDDANRDAITRLSSWHFCATEKAASRVRDVLGGPGRVFVTGCPRIDIASRVTPNPGRAMVVGGMYHDATLHADGRFVVQPPKYGEGTVRVPYVVISFHPDVHQADQAGDQMRAVLDGVHAAWDGDIHLFWPNSDPGAADIVRVVRERMGGKLKTHRSMRDEDYYALLAGARCCVGNSSSFIREGSFLGVPVVLVGDRQKGRETTGNVKYWVPPTADRVGEVIRDTIEEGAGRESWSLYGSGNAAERIAEVLRG